MEEFARVHQLSAWFSSLRENFMSQHVRSNPLKFVILITALFGFSLILGGCNGANTKPAQASSGPPSIPVGVMTAQRRDVPVFQEGLGSVQASNTISLKSRVDGQQVQIAFRERQKVQQGDLLVVIDPRPYQVQLEQAQAALAR